MTKSTRDGRPPGVLEDESKHAPLPSCYLAETIRKEKGGGGSYSAGLTVSSSASPMQSLRPEHPYSGTLRPTLVGSPPSLLSSGGASAKAEEEKTVRLTDDTTQDLLEKMGVKQSKEASATEPTKSTPQGTLIGGKGAVGVKYIKRKLIGTGSYGEAWLVERTTDQAIFVAKVMEMEEMSARDKQYAYSEIKCLAMCDHPNIIKYVEDEECSDLSLVIIMEFADSGDLDRQIKTRMANQCRYFQEHEILFLWIQLCLALEYIHSHKMLHRDLKAANVLLCSNGLLKIGDFGFSHQYENTVSGQVASTFCGTPYYLAPEIWNNQRYSKKADVWSLGVIMYEIMALRHPFTGTNMKELMRKVNRRELTGGEDGLEELPCVCKEMKNVVLKALTVDVNNRPTVREILMLSIMQDGLAIFSQTVEKNSRIAEADKRSLLEHVSSLLNTAEDQSSKLTTSKAHGFIDKDISFEGEVKKLGGLSGKKWAAKYLQLQAGHLVISEVGETNSNNKKALSLEQVQSIGPIPTITSKMEHVFALNTAGGKSVWLQAASKEEMEKWMDYIQRAIGVA